MFDKDIKDNEDIVAKRKAVASIIADVLSEKMTVREGLLKFPKLCKDKSVTTAWHALCHYEADEDLRNNDIEYRTGQDDYMVMLFEILRGGVELPENIIDSYSKYYKGAPLPNEGGLKGYFNTLKRVLNI